MSCLGICAQGAGFPFVWGLYLKVIWCSWVIKSSVFLFRVFVLDREVSSGLRVSLHDVKNLCSFHLFPSWRLWSVWRVFVTVCMVMVSVVFEGLRQVMCSLCRDSVSSFWCLWVSIWAVWSLCVRYKTSYVLGCEVSVWELRIWKLADMILKPGTWHADCVVECITCLLKSQFVS